MIVTLTQNISTNEEAEVRSGLAKLGYGVTGVVTGQGRYLVAIGSVESDIRIIGRLAGVKDVHRVSDPFKFVSRKWKVSPTRIRLRNETVLGEGAFTLMAGPCSIESAQQVESMVAHLNAHGISVMRGGAFKPRTSPYSFRGLGLEGLKMFSEIARTSGVSVITEVLEVSQIEAMLPFVDVFQVGARNSQNFNLLHELGRVDKPVLIKRGLSGTIEELLQSAEYVFSSGNEKIILCERGIRTYEKSYRNTLDLNAIPLLKEKTHLPVLVDPSHGVGIRRFVTPMALAAVMAGADGLLIEVHERPEMAASDGDQTLSYDEAGNLYRSVREVYALREALSE